MRAQRCAETWKLQRPISRLLNEFESSITSAKCSQSSIYSWRIKVSRLYLLHIKSYGTPNGPDPSISSDIPRKIKIHEKPYFEGWYVLFGNSTIQRDRNLDQLWMESTMEMIGISILWIKYHGDFDFLAIKASLRFLIYNLELLSCIYDICYA